MSTGPGATIRRFAALLDVDDERAHVDVRAVSSGTRETDSVAVARALA